MSYSEGYLKGWSDAYLTWQRTNKVPNNPPVPTKAPEPKTPAKVPEPKAPARKAAPRKKTGDK